MGSRKIGGDLAGYARIAEDSGDIVRARLGPATELAEHYLAMGHMMNESGLDPVEANET